LLAYEFMPWHLAHSRQQPLIPDTTLAQLAFHHGEALGCERL
jgi:hypothetical protein